MRRAANRIRLFQRELVAAPTNSSAPPTRMAAPVNRLLKQLVSSIDSPSRTAANCRSVRTTSIPSSAFAVAATPCEVSVVCVWQEMICIKPLAATSEPCTAAPHTAMPGKTKTLQYAAGRVIGQGVVRSTGKLTPMTNMVLVVERSSRPTASTSY